MTWALVVWSTAPAAWGQSPSAPEPVGAAAAPAAASTAAPAPQAKYRIEAGEVVLVLEGEAGGRMPIPGPVLGLYHLGSLLYVARGALGVAVYDVSEPRSPRLVREQVIPGSIATEFFTVGDQVWVFLTARSAQPVDAGGGVALAGAPSAPALAAAPAPAVPSAAPAPGPIEAERASPRLVELTLLRPGTVRIASGTGDGVRVGDRFLIYRSEIVAAAGAGGFSGEQYVGSAEVVAVREDSSIAELTRSAVVRAGDRARAALPTDRRDRLAFPPRVAGVGEYGFVARPLVNIGSPLGAGILADLEASYWGEGYFAGVAVQPLGLGTTADGGVLSIAALAEGGYDGAAFAAGLGAGVGWVNGDIDEMLWSSSADDADDGGPYRTESEQQTHGAFALSQVARLGSRDGTRFSLRNIVLLHRDEDGEQGFIYGGTTGKLAVPIGRRVDLFAEGGGGVMGYWFAGLGVGTWVLGNGGPRSLYLQVSAGAAGISGSRELTRSYFDSVTGERRQYTYTEDLRITGPMLAVGLKRRFEL